MSTFTPDRIFNSLKSRNLNTFWYAIEISWECLLFKLHKVSIVERTWLSISSVKYYCKWAYHVHEFEETNFFILSPNPTLATKIIVSMTSYSWWYEKPSNIPHGWHSKFIKDDTNFILEGELTCFLWDNLKSFLVHSIQFNTNALNINPKHIQDHMTG